MPCVPDLLFAFCAPYQIIHSVYRSGGQAIPGGRLSDISHAIQTHVEAAGFSVVRKFVGHGIGSNLHEEPQIP
ncbi:MAG: M24 family metallopeptidase, partial [Bacteroidales bacterium]|nr:M24 family metallopeptidase [Bacteroidales bacterium]